MTSDTRIHPSPATPVEPENKVEPGFRAAPLGEGAKLGPNTIEKLLITSDSGYTYLANAGKTVVQEYFPQQFCVRDTDGISLLLCDAEFNSDFEQGLSEFLMLARVLSQIDHPGRVTQYEENDGAAWYSVDLPVKASLADLVATGQRLPEENLKSILYSAVTYLEAAHDAGALHLEITPERILLAEEDKLVICGFCTDKLHYPPEDPAAKHDYRAPELASFRGHLGRWTDYYALGAILYQAACKSAPPSGLARLKAADTRVVDPLTPAKIAAKGFFSDSTLASIDNLLALKPTDRPKDAEALINAFEDSEKPLKASADESEPAQSPKVQSPKTVVDQPALSPAPIGTAGPSPRPNGASTRDRISKRLKSATTIAVAALDKTKSSLISAKPAQNQKIKERSAQDKPPSVASRGFRKEPVFDTAHQHLDEAANVPRLESVSKGAFEIADDLEDAGRALSDKPAVRPARKMRNAQKPAILSKLLPTIASSRTRVQELGGLLFQRLVNQSRWKLILGIIIALIVLLGLYVVVTPPRATGDGATRTTIEIIGGNTVTPTKPEALEIASASFAPPDSGTLGTQEFAKDDDLQRVNAYRDADRLTRLSEPHLARAKELMSKGALISPQDANAYSEYATALRMNPDSTEAKQGLERVTRRLLTDIDRQIKEKDFAGAQQTITQAQSLAPDESRFSNAAAKIVIAKSAWEEQMIAQQAIAAAEAEKARLDRERQQQIEAMLARALKAFNAERLVAPPGDNALTLYQAVLDVDPTNQRARNGMSNIATIFVRETRDALSTNDLTGAARSLEIAMAITPDSEAVLSLNQQLKRRQFLITEQQRLQDQAQTSMSLAQEMANEQDQLNLASGIQAYYAGDYDQAYQFLEPLAARNDPRAQVRVARMLLDARGTDRNKPKAISMFSAALAPVQLAASQGQAWAQSDLADYYFDGLVIDKDQRTAALWYQRAAEQGYAPAQTNLGWMYFKGYDGMAPNRAVAVYWFGEAAAQGNLTAANNLRALGEAVPAQTGG